MWRYPRPQHSARFGQRAELQTGLMPCTRSRSLVAANPAPDGTGRRNHSGFLIGNGF